MDRNSLSFSSQAFITVCQFSRDSQTVCRTETTTDDASVPTRVTLYECRPKTLVHSFVTHSHYCHYEQRQTCGLFLILLEQCGITLPCEWCRPNLSHLLNFRHDLSNIRINAMFVLLHKWISCPQRITLLNSVYCLTHFMEPSFSAQQAQLLSRDISNPPEVYSTPLYPLIGK